MDLGLKLEIQNMLKRLQKNDVFLREAQEADAPVTEGHQEPVSLKRMHCTLKIHPKPTLHQKGDRRQTTDSWGKKG